jgi:hypothetical protein
MRQTKRWLHILAVAWLAALLALLVAGCNKVTGGGQFIADGNVFSDFDTTGDRVSFGLTAQPTDAYGDAKGQVTFVDKTVGANMHGSLQFTDPVGGDPFAAYAGYGTLRANFTHGGINKIVDWDVYVAAYDGNGDGNPDYVVFQITEPISGFTVGWSGEVINGNVVVH